MLDYNDLGKMTYGKKCEFDKCGWDLATCDVHHINYQEQHVIENKIRTAHKMNDSTLKKQLVAQAKEQGFLSYDDNEHQLEKDNSSKNLSVLCPNHHRYVHFVDMGMKILDHLPPRK